MIVALYVSSVSSLIFGGAIFGFFFAWVCSTMWGLDAADPIVAIEAMKAMNASVRNWVFAPAFFGTPFILLVTAILAFAARCRLSVLLLASAGLIYLLGGVMLTLAVNVPMNEALAATPTPMDVAEARQVWGDYSGSWQSWNVVRAVVSGITLLLAGIATLTLRPSMT